MKVTVRECLQLDSFKGCIVVAGEHKLENRVRSISVLDASTVEDAIHYNGNHEEMVLTSFSGMKNNIQLQREVLYALARSGISALAIFQKGNGEAQIPKELVSAADETGVPLLIMVDGDKGGYGDLIKEVMDQVLYGNSFKNSLINNTIFHLLNFEKHSSFQQALREAAINNDFQVVLLSEDFNPVLTVETRKKATVDEAISRGKQIALNLTNIYSLVDINGVLTYWGLVTINNEKHYLCIVDNEDNYSAVEITKLADIVELAMGMWKFTPERDARVEFAKALIRGNKSLAYSLRDEAEIKPADIISVFHAKGIEDERGEAVLQEFRESGLLNIIRISEGEETYGIILRVSNIEQETELSEKGLCTKLFDRLKEKKNVRIFHATGVDGIEGAGDGFRLINETWAFVEGIFPYKRVFSKYEMVLVSNCISIQVQGGYLKNNFMELLQPFQTEGDNKAKQLLETLETFVLDAGMNSSKTSEFMGIHTNTVQYRLKKINEVLGAEITGNRVIPGLTVALALKRLERSAKQQNL